MHPATARLDSATSLTRRAVTAVHDTVSSPKEQCVLCLLSPRNDLKRYSRAAADNVKHFAKVAPLGERTSVRWNRALCLSALRARGGWTKAMRCIYVQTLSIEPGHTLHHPPYTCPTPRARSFCFTPLRGPNQTLMRISPCSVASKSLAGRTSAFRGSSWATPSAARCCTRTTPPWAKR